jgi:dTDP-3-amino-2,3,6-trideoxy-4-keto-D-glucose/dTDP-3-amino-3,4,6-trideoxy-alpha-D-glucose/dTDP-2,6-dideoxy-D-kanosamine transaminase
MSDFIQRVDIRQQYQHLRSEILAAVDRVFASGTLILGREVRAFEQTMVEALEYPGQAIGVGSGTDALAIALRALGVGPGDEVLTVANTAVGTVSAILMAGATPLFCDIDPDTLMLDCEDARHRITARTRAVIPVHLFGNAVDMAKVTALARDHGLKIVEDCAQALGTLFRGQNVGTFGDVGCFSFYPTKNLGAYGDGGLCYTRDAQLAETMRHLRMYGCDAHGHARLAGVNSRLDEVQAAILQVKLRHFVRHLHERRRVAEAYSQRLAPYYRRAVTTPGAFHSYCLYVVRVAHRVDVLARMARAGIECGVHYPLPIHLMDAFQPPDNGDHPWSPQERFAGKILALHGRPEVLHCPLPVHQMAAIRPSGGPAGSLPHTERSACEVLSLPCHPELPESSLDRIITVLNDAV